MNFDSSDGSNHEVSKCRGDGQTTEGNKSLSEMDHAVTDKHWWVPSLVQFQPMYELGYGNVSKVELENGTIFPYRHSSIRTHRDVARYYAMDLFEMRNLYRTATSRSLSVPIVIASRDLVFVPLRVRTPRTKNDGCMGYIGHRFIADVSRIVTGRKFEGLCITLTTGTEVFVDMTKPGFEQQLKDAKYFMYYLRERQIYF